MATFDIPIGAYDIQFQKGLNSVGYGSFKIDSDTFSAHLSTASPSDEFNIYLNNTLVYTFIWEETGKRFKDDYWEYTISGRGSVAKLRKVLAYPDTSKQRLVTSTSPYEFYYEGTTYSISESSGVTGVYIRNEVDPRTNLGDSVGAILQTMIDDGNYRNAAVPNVVGAGTTDANGVSWNTFPDSNSFKVRIGKDMLSVVEDMAKKGLCIYKQVGTTLYVYRPDTNFTTADFSKENHKIKNLEMNEDHRGKTNHALIVDSEVVTSYRPDQNLTSTEKGISIEISNNPNVHASIGQEEKDDHKNSVNMGIVITDTGKNPLIDFDVGDNLTYSNAHVNFTYKVLSVSVKKSNEHQFSVANIELGDFNIPVKTVDTENNEDIKDVSHRATGGTSGGSNEVMEYGKAAYDQNGMQFDFTATYTNIHSVNVEILTTDNTLFDSSDFQFVNEYITDTNGQYTGLKVYPKGSSIPANNTAIEVAFNAICS